MFGKALKEELSKLKEEDRKKDKRIRDLENLCKEKDSYFIELMSDGMRHGSSLAAKHMRDRKDYLKRK